jgi:hypothetical protein
MYVMDVREQGCEDVTGFTWLRVMSTADVCISSLIAST